MKVRAVLTAALFAMLLIVGVPSMGHALTCTFAAPCSFIQLNGTVETITFGDKTFSDFFGSLSGVGDFSPPSVNNINVGAGLVGGNIALLFTGGMFAGAASDVDITLGYTVTASGALISDIHLIGNPAFTGTGNTDVVETASGGVGNIAQAHIFAGSGGSQLSDSADLPTPVGSVDIAKDVLLHGGPDGTASISVIDQIVTQKVPAPASLLLLGAGLFGASVAARRRRA